MFCTHCGTENADSSQFCSRCRAALHAQPITQENAGNLARGTPPSTAYLGPVETSGKAIVSLICGILFFLFPVALAAVVLGHLSLTEIRKSAGRLAGEGMAIAGLVLGYVGLAFIPFILIIAAIAIPNLLRSRMAANEASAVALLRTVVIANMTYASTYENGYAAELSELGGPETGAADCNHAQLLNENPASGYRNGYHFDYATKQAPAGQAAISPEAAAKDPPQINLNKLDWFYILQGCPALRDFEIGC